MLVLLIVLACIFGMVLCLMGLSSAIGYLLAGFAYNFPDLIPLVGLESMDDLGITLLLFSIGLKPGLRYIARTELTLLQLFIIRK